MKQQEQSSEENKCLISVIMGVYHHGKNTDLLKRSISSILAQTYGNFEFLICDSGSGETASKLLDSFATEDKRIVLLRDDLLPTDLASKLNACLRCAKGDLIARMDDDDYSHPERFMEQLKYLEEHSDIAFVGSNVKLWRNHEELNERKFPEFPKVEDFYITQPFIHPALIFRKSVLDQVNGYSEEKQCLLCEDYDLLLRIYAQGYKGANIQVPLLDYTVPLTARGNRKMRHRWNETVTRWRRFRELKKMPGAMPYVIKPLLVGLIPEEALKQIKKLR